VFRRQDTIYEFPTLAECREAFARMMQQEFNWDGPDEWTREPPAALEDKGPGRRSAFGANRKTNNVT
jgi:hypothetical protein